MVLDGITDGIRKLGATGWDCMAQKAFTENLLTVGHNSSYVSLADALGLACEFSMFSLDALGTSCHIT